MNEQQQRIAIAESLGLIKRREDPGCGGKYLYAWEILEGVAEGTFATVNRLMKHTPDYLNDLNSCHEFEKTLTDDEWAGYVTMLDLVIDEDRQLDGYELELAMIHAKAKYKCEAYLRAKGLWQAEGM